MTKQDLIKKVEQWSPRSAWDKGVKELMFMMIECESKDVLHDLKTTDVNQLYSLATEYSYNGHLNIYDNQIAKQFCTPSELKRVKGGNLPPSSKELWADLQARACYQAFLRFINLLELCEQ